MSQLVKIFPNGRTVHIPADGQPLPGYALALADVERRGGEPSGASLQAARAAGVITASQVQVAEQPKQPKRSLLARIFGSGKDLDEQSELPAPKAAKAEPSKRVHAPMALASLSPPKRVAVERIAPLPTARPKPVALATVLPRPRPAGQTIVTASAAPVVDNRGLWAAKVEAGPALPPPIVAGTRFETASLDPANTGSTADQALAYAADAQEPLAARTRPMGSRLPHMPAEARVIPASSNSSVAVKPPPAALAMGLGLGGAERADSPWLRAAMLTPSVRGFMTATRLGTVDVRWQSELLHKPAQSLVATFSADPHLGMVAERFSGDAVVFLATATFTPQTTASLR